MNVFVVDDDREMCEILQRYILSTKINYSVKVSCFANAVEAIGATNEVMPDLIFLDVLLDGPDGFTLLNELQSYDDLAKVPVVIVSSLALKKENASGYNIVGCLDKSSMVPEQIQMYVERYTANE